MKRGEALSTLLLTMAALAPAQVFVGFDLPGREQEIKGKPKSVRVERQDFRDEKGNPASGRRYLKEVTEYRPDRQQSEHRTYNPDGALAQREVYEYDDQGKLLKVTTFDAQKAPVRRQQVRRPEPGIEELIELTPDGKPRSRTINRLDQAGRMVESTVMESDDEQIRLTLEHDDQGRPIQARVTFKGGQGFPLQPTASGFGRAAEMGMRIQIVYQADQQALVTIYGSDGAILLQIETTEDGAGRELSRVLFDLDNGARNTTIEQIDAVDSEGNWTQKTILERNPRTQADEPTAVLYRTITYY